VIEDVEETAAETETIIEKNFHVVVTLTSFVHKWSGYIIFIEELPFYRII